LGGEFRGAVGGVIVIDVNRRLRKGLLGVLNHLKNGFLFVIAGD